MRIGTSGRSGKRIGRAPTSGGAATAGTRSCTWFGFRVLATWTTPATLVPSLDSVLKTAKPAMTAAAGLRVRLPPSISLAMDDREIYRFCRRTNWQVWIKSEAYEARLVREGSDVTVVTYGALVQRSVLAAIEAAEEGLEVEILDLRTLSPLDFESVARSVKKTGRVIVAHEDTMFCGYGGEVAALIADRCFMDLDAPVKRVAALDCMVAYAPKLEDYILPQKDDLLRAMLDIASF